MFFLVKIHLNWLKGAKRTSERGCQESIIGKTVGQLQQAIEKYKEIFNLRLGSGVPADVSPKTITLDPKRNLSEPKRENTRTKKVNTWTSTFRHFNTEFIKACSQAQLEVALYLVKNALKSEFRTTIDLRPVSAATKAEQGPMPKQEAELSDFIKTHFCIFGSVRGLLTVPMKSQHIWAHGKSLRRKVPFYPLVSSSDYRMLPHTFKQQFLLFLESSKRKWKPGLMILRFMQNPNKNRRHIWTLFAIWKRHNLRLSSKACSFYGKQ